jgi:hypothetical protein
MLHRDYLMQLVEELSRALVKIAFFKEEKKYDDALLEIRNTGKSLIGIDLNMLNYISDADLLALFKPDDPTNAGRFLVLAGLLNEEGEIDFEMNNKNEGYRCYLKALVLYCEAVKFKDVLNPEKYFEKIDLLIVKLNEYLLSANTKNSLIGYYEICGKYSKAEDLIFEMAETGDEQVINTGISFYKRLLLKTDEEIEKGNLNREEVENAIRELKSLHINDTD